MELLFRLLLILFSSLLLYGCGNETLAPVSSDTPDLPRHHDRYVVRDGDTLFSIAFAYGMDYRALADVNHIPAPYAIQTGQIIRIKPNASVSASYPHYDHVPKTVSHKTSIVNKQTQPIKSSYPSQPLTGGWLWPAQGKVITRFSPNSGNKGINISNQQGTPILATAAGQVVYAGSGLSGYGELLIIKHNDEYLSAYAHNEKLLVKEGDTVTKGQEIATMGDTGSNRVMLHFEIRKAGQPVDPLSLLPTH